MNLYFKENNPITSRLALGTVQLGLPYGIANQHGQPSIKEAREIISIAFEHGVRVFDTAQSYGESESILGRCFSNLNIADKVRVISKLHPDLPYHDQSCVTNSVMNSLQTLTVSCLYGLMLHRPSWLKCWDKGLGFTLQELRKKGMVIYLGVSVYTPEEAYLALDMEEIDIIQAPFNLFDRRFLFEGVFARAFELKKKIFIRSFFLQGLLMLSPETLPDHLIFARPWLTKLHAFCLEHGLDKKEFAFKYAWQKTRDASLVSGVETKEQIRENLEIASRSDFETQILEDWEAFIPEVPQKLINPSLWV